MGRAVIVMREQKKSPAGKFAELLEWMDYIAFRHPGWLVAFDIAMLIIVIGCTMFNLSRWK